jgi:hypothetical protein
METLLIDILEIPVEIILDAKPTEVVDGETQTGEGTEDDWLQHHERPV